MRSVASTVNSHLSASLWLPHEFDKPTLLYFPSGSRPGTFFWILCLIRRATYGGTMCYYWMRGREIDHLLWKNYDKKRLWASL